MWFVLGDGVCQQTGVWEGEGQHRHEVAATLAHLCADDIFEGWGQVVRMGTPRAQRYGQFSLL